MIEELSKDIPDEHALEPQSTVCCNTAPSSSHSAPLEIRTTFTNALVKVERVIGLLEAQGIKYSSSSSVGSLFSKVRQLNKQYALDPIGYEQRTFLASIEALWIAEALEIAIGEPGAREVVHRIVTSDMSLSERRWSNGKDALWELDLYRRLKLGGAEVIFGEPDLVLELSNGLGKLGLACKKTYSESGVAEALNGGCDQLRKHRMPGIVAFNLDDLVDERSVLSVPSNETLHEALISKVRKFVTNHAATLNRAIERGECDGVLISITVVSQVHDAASPIRLARAPMLYGYPGELSSTTKLRLEAFRQCLDRAASRQHYFGACPNL